jgi:hypothetical protein
MPEVYLDADEIRRTTFIRHVEIHDTLRSTNDRAAELARDPDIQLPALIAARQQTAGRGRGSNTWWSADGALTLSIVLDPAAFGIGMANWPQLSLATAVAQQMPQGVQKVTSVEGITEYSLPDGLRVLLFPDTSKPKVTVNMTYLVGSRHEGYGETGMAHLLEHMLFKETKTGRDVKKELSDHGADFNGSTSVDRTNYYETVQATPANLQWALGLEAERMTGMKMEKACGATCLKIFGDSQLLAEQVRCSK